MPVLAQEVPKTLPLMPRSPRDISAVGSLPPIDAQSPTFSTLLPVSLGIRTLSPFLSKDSNVPLLTPLRLPPDPPDVAQVPPKAGTSTALLVTVLLGGRPRRRTPRYFEILPEGSDMSFGSLSSQFGVVEGWPILIGTKVTRFFDPGGFLFYADVVFLKICLSGVLNCQPYILFSVPTIFLFHILQFLLLFYFWFKPVDLFLFLVALRSTLLFRILPGFGKR
jgi:hypothetical protein